MLLVIDTCFNACSAALYNEVAGRVVASGYAEMERGHAEALGPMVEHLFAESGARPEQLSRIAVTYGPGTFTGLRIGLSFAKGMALALGLPLVGLNSLKATAQHRDEKVIIAHKAGGSGLFYWTSPKGPALGAADEILAVARNLNRSVIGSGIAGAQSVWPDAKVFAAYAASLPVTDANVDPLYLRAPEAKPSADAASSTAKVRLATATDTPGLAAIHKQCFDAGWDEASLAASLAVPGAGACVVELAGTTYGFVQFQWVAGEAEINTICVLPNYRRQHFGSDLMQGLVDYLATYDTSKLFLEVAADNLAARKLYERFGFQQTGVRKGYYAAGSDALTMTLVLPGDLAA